MMHVLRQYVLAAAAGLILAGSVPVHAVGGIDTSAAWASYEDLVSRLSAENYRIGLLEKDLAGVAGLLDEMRSVELYPQTASNLTDDALVTIDRALEGIDKKLTQIKSDVASVRAEVTDAAGILREMAGGEPVEEMFVVLEKGDIERLSRLLSIKHRIDALLDETDMAIARVAGSTGFASIIPLKGATDDRQEFINILKRSIAGEVSSRAERIALIKDSILHRATIEMQSAITQTEFNLAKQDLANGNAGTAISRAGTLLRGHARNAQFVEIRRFLTKAHFIAGNDVTVLASIDSLPQEFRVSPDIVTCQLQALYRLDKCAEAWNLIRAIDFSTFTGEERNISIWIAIECGMRTGLGSDYTRLTAQADMAAPYNLHVLHALGRSYIKADKLPLAVSILRTAMAKKPETPADKQAARRIRLTTAQVLLESGEAQPALELFFQILSSGDYFEEALSGIAWCYIRLGQFQSAEATLLKLINQAPASPEAADAFTVVAKRLSAKAGYEWRKASSVMRERANIQERISQIDADTTQKDERAIAKIRQARTALAAALQAVDKEKTMPVADIEALHARALDLCTKVSSYYASGSFSRVQLSARREHVLHRIDSLVTALGAKGAVTTAATGAMSQPGKILLVKSLVLKSRLLAAELSTNRWRFVKDRIEFEKKLQSETATRFAKSTDSLGMSLRARARAAVDSLIASSDMLIDQWYTDIRNRSTLLLAEQLDPSDEAYLLYQLGELEYQRENRLYARAYDHFEIKRARYDSLMERYSSGSVTERPVEPDAPPVLAHDSSIAAFKTALSLAPDSELTAATLYSLSWCHNDLGRFDSAVSCLATVADSYPESRFAAQAWMFIGEHEFDNNRLDKAADAYRKVMAYTGSEWFDDALYKLAWTQYRLSNPEKAISSFLALVDLGKTNQTGRSLLEKESLDYIAISFSECDLTGDAGLTRAVSFARKIGDASQGTRILHRLAQVYKEQGRFDLAEKSYRRILSMYPDYEKNPQIESELFAVAARNLPALESNDRKLDFFNKYNRTGDWAKNQRDTTAVAFADSVAQSYLYDAALVYHQSALTAGDTGSYARALDAYRRFITVYPSSNNANECHYNLAEILFSIGRYSEAAREYIAVSRRYPDGKYRETAAWNAIVAAQNELKMEGETK